MPEMTPVANTVIAPDPQQGLRTLSNIIGISQAKQNLQTGAIQQQEARATMEQAQQKNQEMQKAQALVFDGARNGQYTGPDGSLDRAKLSQDIAGIGPYAQEMASSLLSQANEVVSNKQAHQNLTLSQKKEIGATFASLASDPEVDNTKVIDAIESLRQQHPNDPGFSRMLTSMSAHMPNAGTPQQLQQIMGRWSAAATQEPQVSPSTVDTGTQIVPGATNKFTGGFTPAGGPVRKDIAGVATATGGAINDTERASQISKSVAPSRAAITLSDQIIKLSNEVHTGKYSKAVTDFAATIGQKDPTIAARQLMSKYAAQLTTVAEANAPSDSARQQISAGFPDPEHMSPEAIRGAAEFIKGGMKMNLSRAANARRFQETHGSPSGLRIADDSLTSNADPLMYIFKELPAGTERQEFLKRHFSNHDQAREFVQRMNAVEHYGGFEQ